MPKPNRSTTTLTFRLTPDDLARLDRIAVHLFKLARARADGSTIEVNRTEALRHALTVAVGQLDDDEKKS